jgi:hypothetical protein
VIRITLLVVLALGLTAKLSAVLLAAKRQETLQDEEGFSDWPEAVTRERSILPWFGQWLFSFAGAIAFSFRLAVAACVALAASCALLNPAQHEAGRTQP